MTDPRHICAVIPTFNNGGTVAGVVRGVLHQGFPVIVVDDGSRFYLFFDRCKWGNRGLLDEKVPFFFTLCTWHSIF